MRAISRIRCGLLDRPTRLLQHRREAAPVVEAQVVREELLVAEGQPLFAQNPGEQRLMQGLVVDEDAVEIEEDGAQHVARDHSSARRRRGPPGGWAVIRLVAPVLS